ncbi:MAG TPA: cytochrome c oxidase subunit 3 [Woeseiaceae bacterium]|nr:cytochrome c oxidase subunit 3 [Woeseiaceae bacterium]
MTEAERPVIDAAKLPSITFGYHGTTWWATAAFMVIEGTTLIVLLVSYVYLRRNFVEWPPPPTALPDLLVPTINLALLLFTIVPMALARRAAHSLDLHGVRVFLVSAVLLAAVTVVLRGFEFAALNVRWDSDAYGSSLWMLLGLHTTLLVIDLLESGAIAALMFSKGREPKHFVDVEEAAVYQWFLSISYVPVYVLIFLGPRLL